MLDKTSILVERTICYVTKDYTVLYRKQFKFELTKTIMSTCFKILLLHKIKNVSIWGSRRDRGNDFRVPEMGGYKCNGSNICMNGTTSGPKSILLYVLVKVKLIVPIRGTVLLCQCPELKFSIKFFHMRKYPLPLMKRLTSPTLGGLPLINHESVLHLDNQLYIFQCSNV